MATSFSGDINLQLHQLLEAVLEKLASAPDWTPGRIYFDTTLNGARVATNTTDTWVTLGAGGGGGGGAVDSVNAQTGDVSLDQDDIGDGTNFKQFSAANKTKLAGIEDGAEANDVDSVAGKTGAVTLVANDITNASTTGKNVLTAADAAAARTAIGAGTSSFDGTYSALTGKPTLGDLADENIIHDVTGATVSTTRPWSGTTSKTYVDGINTAIQAQITTLTAAIDALSVKVGGIEFGTWSGTAWKAWDGDSWDGTISSSSAVVHVYISVQDADADPPTYYGPKDLWFAEATQAADIIGS